jgi:DNA mismatch repair ATPase MutS
MAAGIFSINNLSELLYGSSRTESFAELIDLLQTNTFKGSASFFSLSGRVLAGYRLMTDEKEHFAPALAAIGEIDACLSMAKLYKKMQNERVGYCFVDFVEHQKPSLNIVDFWNPFVDAKIVVTNSLELGLGADASKVILTGSNTGGKSTILKAIMMSLLMGHVFGMAPAQEMTLTPFAFIGSYLRVNDDTASGDSKFKAEVMRAKMLCETMDALPKNQFGFVVIDELFTGTGSEKASNAAGKVAQKLAGLENNLFILATHFPILTELEKTNSGLIKNYKVDVFKDEAGNLIRPFKLEVGVSDSNIANDILQEQIQDIDFSI